MTAWTWILAGLNLGLMLCVFMLERERSMMQEQINEIVRVLNERRVVYLTHSPDCSVGVTVTDDSEARTH
jgi:mannose/fructose-specific phosphotransferase system component IIA